MPQSDYYNVSRTVARENGLPESLLESLISVQSGGDPNYRFGNKIGLLALDSRNEYPVNPLDAVGVLRWAGDNIKRLYGSTRSYSEAIGQTLFGSNWKRSLDARNTVFSAIQQAGLIDDTGALVQPSPSQAARTVERPVAPNVQQTIVLGVAFILLLYAFSIIAKRSRG